MNIIATVSTDRQVFLSETFKGVNICSKVCVDKIFIFKESSSSFSSSQNLPRYIDSSLSNGNIYKSG